MSDNVLETDEDIHSRLEERFDILDRITAATSQGSIKGLVVTGAPGVGKSFGVEAALARESLVDKLAWNPDADDQDMRRIVKVWDASTNTYTPQFKARHKVVKGHITAPAMHRVLYEYNAHKETVVFDDCDSALGDEITLNLLKAALDTSTKREITWLNSSNRNDDVPNTFEYKGTVIFITNIDFEKVVAEGKSKLAPHLEAIMSRCLYLDLTIRNTRERLVRINHVCRNLKMLEKKGLNELQVNEVLDFTFNNAERFRELSLRKVGQLADLRLSHEDYWSRMAEVTLLKNR